jgi:hypothetical protein
MAGNSEFSLKFVDFYVDWIAYCKYSNNGVHLTDPEV